MSKLLEQAIDLVRSLPEATQDDVARFLMDLADDPLPTLNPDEAAAIAEAEAEIARGESVPAETMKAFWRTHAE